MNVLLLSSALASQGVGVDVQMQGNGPDPPGIPAEFLCGWRRLALNYTQQVRPDGANSAYEALELQKYCGDERPTPGPVVFPAKETPSASRVLFVDAKHGSDDADGTESEPMRTPHAALQKLRTSKQNSSAIVFRGGRYYFSQTLDITTDDVNLTLQNFPGEEVWLTGSQEIQNLEWKEYDLSSGKNIWEVDLAAYNFSEISELRVNGERVAPARFPNANVELDIFPTGYLQSSKGDWLAPKISPNPNPAHEVQVVGRAWDTEFYNYSGGIGGTCSIFDPPFSYWCASHFKGNCGGCQTWRIPGGFSFGNKLGNKTYHNMENAKLFAWRKSHWANWAFEIQSYHPENSTFMFGKGGFQGARGGIGSDWFISHVLEELDAPTEFYYSSSAKKLYYFHAGEGPPPASTKFEVVQQHSLIRAVGSQTSPVRGFRVLGLGFRDTAHTMMEPHGVPSGGDWSLERMGVLMLEGVEDASVEKIKMWRIGGNGIMLSKYANRSHIVDSEFVWFGGTAIAAWGWTDEISDGGIHGIDGTGGDFPRFSLIERNIFREIGIWEKQASAFFQAKAAQTTLRHNVAFNLARAGFNFNDGFGGGDQVYENVLFNTCRESADHGPINSWDRQPFITTILNGTPTSQMAWREISRNVVISNYGGFKEVDNDDGSLFYKIHHNFMAYGWGQKFKCGGIESFNNIKAFIALGGRFDVGCTTGPNAFYPNLWHNDTMIHLGNSDFDYRLCWGSDSSGHDWDKTQVQNNTIYMLSNKTHAIVTCGKQKERIALSDFQSDGSDPGSRELYGYPSSDAILFWARQTIGPTWDVERGLFNFLI